MTNTWSHPNWWMSLEVARREDSYCESPINLASESVVMQKDALVDGASTISLFALFLFVSNRVCVTITISFVFVWSLSFEPVSYADYLGVHIYSRTVRTKQPGYTGTQLLGRGYIAVKT